jgi:hypothetical protein
MMGWSRRGIRSLSHFNAKAQSYAKTQRKAVATFLLFAVFAILRAFALNADNGRDFNPRPH